ncbi:hypothetical protein [Cyclobacterium amurskyense]|uniref:hypothetical protein n=1 Tax=Cyclobacterium amurskyense TaxID=320787 RepID=UPI0030DC3121|tara:strand:- start:3128 stop:3550 length:423 start_codon:yes stop_codon:yes gene_type:complete
MELTCNDIQGPYALVKFNKGNNYFEFEDFRCYGLDAIDELKLLDFLPKKLKCQSSKINGKYSLQGVGVRSGKRLFFSSLTPLQIDHIFLLKQNPFIDSSGLRYEGYVKFRDDNGDLLLWLIPVSKDQKKQDKKKGGSYAG